MDVHLAAQGLIIGDLGFPWWLRAAHWLNAFFIGFLIRSGIQILGSYPRLFWRDDSTPGSEWIRFTRRQPPADRLWTSLEEERDVPGWLGQPGGNNLGHGRHWHFFIATGWLLTGIVYVLLLFVTGEWQRLIPASWSIVPDALQTFAAYVTLQLPPASAFHPYDPLQQLAYAAVVFLLGPFMIATAAAQSPAIEAQFPWYPKIFGGRQRARSLHFLGLLAFVVFILIHTALIIVTGLGRNLGDIVLGQHTSDQGLAITLGIGIIAAIFAIYALTSWATRRWPRKAQQTLGKVIRPWMRAITEATHSRQEFTRADLSPVFTVNGDPPQSAEYLNLLWGGFACYQLEIRGLVAHPQSFSLAELKAMPRRTQITRHNCIQGWTAIGEWSGVHLREILARCKPLANARYIVFWSHSHDTAGKPFYEVIPIVLATHPQTILAYEMNGRPLPMPHGAPLRLRVETMLGFKMTKWIAAIEFVEDYRQIRGGQGGSREDEKYFEVYAGI